jgi:hypothetical protein
LTNQPTTPALDLIEELDAFDPKWRHHYSTLHAASVAADVEDLYARFLTTSAGATLAERFDVPDYAGAAVRSRESVERFVEASDVQR